MGDDGVEEDPTGVRRMLSGMPEPEPMSPDLVDRISDSIADESLRHGHGSVRSFDPAVEPPRRPHVRGLLLGGAAVTGVGLVAAGTLLTTTADPRPQAALTVTAEQAGSTSASAKEWTTLATGTEYERSRLGTQAAALRTDPEAPAADPHPPASDTLRACLRDLGLTGRPAVVDRATLDGRDALVVVAGSPQRLYRTLVVVDPDCGNAPPERLAGPYRIR